MSTLPLCRCRRRRHNAYTLALSDCTDLWLHLRWWWQRLGLFTASSSTNRDSLFRAILSLELPQTPPKVWELATLHHCPTTSTDSAADPYPILQAVWLQLALETMVLIYSWRNADHDVISQRTDHQSRAMHAANCSRILKTVATRYASNPKAPTFEAALVWELLSVFQREGEPEQLLPSNLTHSTLIFVAGSAAPVSGTGGAGAVIAQVDSSTGAVAILWQAAIPVESNRPTHQHASYAGLLAALTAAVELDIRAPTVIGDSALTLRQLHQHRPPRNPKLRRLYSQARRLADRLMVNSWRHHFKVHNRTATSLATLARNSSHPSPGNSSSSSSTHQTTLCLLHSDTLPWLASTTSHSYHIQT